MRSQLEIEFSHMLRRARGFLSQRDRFVLIGSALSFTPFFPACLFGAIISLANLKIGKGGRLKDEDLRIAKIGAVAGLILTAGWIALFLVVNPFEIISTLLDGIISFCDFIIYLLLPSGLEAHDLVEGEAVVFPTGFREV